MKNAILILSLFFATTANAAWLGGRTPVYIFGSSTINFGILNPPYEKGLCSYYSRNFRFDATTEAGKNMLSILLAAKMANKKIDVWYTPSTAPGTNQTNGCAHSAMAVLNSIGISEL